MRILLLIIWSYVFFTTTRNEEISDGTKWCSLMDKYYQTLSQYSFVTDSKTYNVANLDDWGKKGAKQGLIITPKNFGNFFEKMKNYIPTKERASLWNKTNPPSPKQIKELNTILSLTLKFKPKVTCYRNEGRMVVQGNILTTDLILGIQLQYDECYNEAKYLEIYATDTIILNAPLYSDGKSMIIIAPIWSVHRNTYISITENNNRIPPSIELCRGKCPRDGEPGNPGYSSGNFLGIGATFINMHRLIAIYAEGGEGGEGGPGQDGKTGKKDGGRGGAGGLGGLGGTVNIITFDNNSNFSIKIYNSPGPRGRDGKAGKGGMGGKNEQGLDCSRGGYFESKNQANTKCPTPKFDLNTIISNVSSNFTDLMRKSLINVKYTQKKNYDFLLQLYRNNNVMKNYNTMQLVQEFIALESDYYLLFDKVDLLPIYEALQDHIMTRFQNSSSENYKTTESDVVLIHLYITLQSKICILQDAAKSTLITDMNIFLNIFTENVNLLRENNVYQVIMETGERYSKEIDAKVEEAYKVINKSVIPKIIEATNKTEGYVKGLILDLNGELEKIKDDKEKLEAKKKQLEKSKSLAIVSGVFKFIGFIGSLIPKIGPIVKIGCDIITTTADTFNKGSNYQSTTDYEDLTNVGRRSSEKMAELEKFSKEIEKDLDIFGTGEVSARSFGETLNAVESGWNAVKEGINEVDSIANDVEKYDKSIERVDNDIKKNEKAQNFLKETKANVEKILIPVLNTFKKIIWEVVTNAKGKSFASLSLAQRKINSFVNELMDILQTLAKKFPSGGKMIKTIESVISDVKLIIDINKNLLGYIENKKMGKLMVDLQSARYQSSSIKNPEYQKALNKLKICLNTNIILTDYKQTSEQIRQYVFPLARAFMGKRNMKSFLMKINNQENILEFAKNEINLFRTQLSRSNSFIMKYDEIRYRTRFDVETPVKSFFVWKYTDENRKQIQELLAGKEVFFRATPDFHLDKNAVKFNKISLVLMDNADQHYLDRILVNFKIIMVHTGENEYICDNKSYVINTPKVTFQYSFGNDSYKKPLFRNVVYDKLVGGNYQLSPFTLWKFQLVNISSTTGYEKLKKFYHEAFNVHLVGEGEYYESNSQVCGNDLDEYYEPLIQSEKKKSKKPCIYGVPYTEDHISAV